MARSTRQESPSAYPSTALSYRFLSCAVSVERKQKEKRDREVREERRLGRHFSGSATVPECGHNKQAREAQAGQL